MSRNYELLKERALSNFELLLIKWEIHYANVGRCEYDFLSPTRTNDANLGACRFNTNKGVGADFAGTSATPGQITGILGPGFDVKDLAGFTQYGEARSSFDIIGLAQRVHNLNGYKEAAEKLEADLNELDQGKFDKTKLLTQMIQREAELQVQREKSLLNATKLWQYCADVNGTIAENYLKSRGIIGPYNEPNMKFHPQVYNKELSTFIPAVVFKISKTPISDLQGVHRIWIARDGSRKAHLSEAKKAIGSIQGNGIWFGEADKTLYVCEGPEEALSVVYGMNRKFVVSTVYATNYHALTIPNCVETVILYPDRDPAGQLAAGKAHKEYLSQNKKVHVMLRS